MIIKVDVKVAGDDEFMRCGSNKAKIKIKFITKNRPQASTLRVVSRALDSRPESVSSNPSPTRQLHASVKVVRHSHEILQDR